MTHIRKAAAFGLLVIALAFPTGAFAASTGSTTESLTLASTIAMVVNPTTTLSPIAPVGRFVGTVNLSGLDTDALGGLNVKATFSNLTGPTTVGVANRAFKSNGAASAGVTDGNYILGDITSTSTQYLVASTAAAGVGGSTSFSDEVFNVTVPGTYSGHIDFVASAN